MRIVSTLAVALVFLGISDSGKADRGVDSIYINGEVHTVNSRSPRASAFAVSGGRFIAVGSNKSIEKLKGENTIVHDLAGRLVLPGIVDDHMHPDLAVESYYNVNIDAEATTFQEFKDRIEQYRINNPQAKWIFGGNLDYLWDDGSNIRMFGVPSHKSVLDQIIPDKPAYFWEVSGHAALVNSKALEALGITRDTPDPVGGHFVKDENGELTGVVREMAAHVFWEEFLKHQLPPQKLAYDRVQHILHYLNSLGLTSITDVWARESYLKAYKVLDEQGDLSVRLSAYVSDPVEWTSNWMKEKAKRPIDNPQAYSSENVRVLGVKFVLDGGAAGRTAVMTEPYEGEAEYTGPWRNDPQVFLTKFLEYDRRGLTVRVHAAGDGAMRWALDAFERSRKEHGSSLRHGIAHTAILNPADIHRFSELGVIAEISPVFWYQMPAVAIIENDIGMHRVNWLYPTRQLLDSGARMSVGTDWTVTPANPWIAIETLVTRRAPGATEGPALVPAERITLEEAVEMYTLGGAYAQYRENDYGSIEPGKLADFIIVNQNIFKVPVEKVHQTKVISTIVGGREVYNQATSKVIDF